MEDKKIINEVIEYLDYLETPSENFGGMAVCPFLRKERVTKNLMIEISKLINIRLKNRCYFINIYNN